jgi:peptidoglycan/xylan/chitin deacetylase (PgdA/CDA1 family)/SAM-dependent methyltransferase
MMLAFADLRLAALPLGIFLILCIIAPFAQRLRFFLPIARRGSKKTPSVAITFDDGPDPHTTPLLLDMLSEHAVSAAFFVIGEKAEAHPELIREILIRGHEIGNHSYSHYKFLMLRGADTILKEIAACQKILEQFGIKSLAFRPPVGITNPPLFSILIQLGMYCAGFSCRAADFGNRRVPGMSRRILGKVRAGDVILLHDRLPAQEISVQTWLREVDDILKGIETKGFKAARLSEVIQRPVMEPTDSNMNPNMVRLFYDGLAGEYDAEQDRHSIVRQAEQDVILNRLPRLLQKTDAVLEIGAGTGRFTLELANYSREVLAVDLSGRMLEILRQKAENAGVSNIRTLQGDIRQMDLEGVFDVICAFSCLEYINDLEELFRYLRPHLKKNGTLYFTIAHRSFFRFFAQIGNAMRQGIWLHARSKKEITCILKRAGFSPTEISAHGLKSVINGGVLMEAVCVKRDA